MTFRYSPTGELAGKGGAVKDATFDYDALGNLRSAGLPGGPRIDDVLDGVNPRVGKKANGKLVQGLLYGGRLAPVAGLEGLNNVVGLFAYATRANVPEYVEKSEGLASDEFGNVVQDTNPGVQPFGFAGGIYDPHTRLTRFGTRDYDAGTGRWTTKDPIRFEGGEMNLYAYGYNDPNNFVDPSNLAGENRYDKAYGWSEGGSVKGMLGDFKYTGSGWVAPPSQGGEGLFGGTASFEGP